MRVTVQVFIMCAFQLLAYSYWELEMLEPSFLPGNYVQSYISEMIWILWNSMPPFIYLTFNKSLLFFPTLL